MRYDLVCLDAGFTILSPRRTLAEALSGTLARHGHEVDREQLRAAWEVADRWFWDEYHRSGNLTWTDDERIEAAWRRYHALMLGELGVEARDELLDLILASQFSADAWEPYPDAVGVMRQLQGAVRMGVVSDWGSNLHAILAELELDRYVDFVLASGSVGLAKPDPALFRVAIERVGSVPERSLMVGDSYRADVLGAWAAGMDAVLLDRSGEEEHRGALPEVGTVRATRIGSLEELLPIVRGEVQVARGDPAALAETIT